MFCPWNRIPAVLLIALAGSLLVGCATRLEPVAPYPGRVEPSTAETMPQDRAALPGTTGVPSPDSGVTTGPADQQQVPMAEELLSVLTQVDDRIAAYDQKTQAWEMLESKATQVESSPELNAMMAECRNRLQAIQGTYNQLNDHLIGMGAGLSPDAATVEQLRAVTQEDIGFLESECQRLLAGGQGIEGRLAGDATQALAAGEKAIHDAMAGNDFAEVIRLYEQLPAGDGLKPAFASTYSYGQALLRFGREEDAGRVFANLLQEMEQSNQAGQVFQLMQLVADIRFGLEDYANAFTGYVNIINRYAALGENIEWARKQQAVISARHNQSAEVKQFATLMRAYLGFNQVRDGYKVVLLAEGFLTNFPESMVAPTVNRILFESRDSAEAWYAEQFTQISSLKEAGRTAEALRLLQALPLENLPADKQAQLQGLSDEMTAMQAQEIQKQQALETAAFEDAWRKGQEHLVLKEYDQAIAVFSGLLDTSYAEQARDRIDEAASLAAQQNRQKAAELFVQAGTAKDQSDRVALLQQSRQLLLDILEKYPQSDLVDKVHKNLERIEQELVAIDPALLAAPLPSAAPEKSAASMPGQEGDALDTRGPANGQPAAQPETEAPRINRVQE